MKSWGREEKGKRKDDGERQRSEEKIPEGLKGFSPSTLGKLFTLGRKGQWTFRKESRNGAEW